jgi:hypothetical protein
MAIAKMTVPELEGFLRAEFPQALAAGISRLRQLMTSRAGSDPVVLPSPEALASIFFAGRTWAGRLGGGAVIDARQATCGGRSRPYFRQADRSNRPRYCQLFHSQHLVILMVVYDHIYNLLFFLL